MWISYFLCIFFFVHTVSTILAVSCKRDLCPSKRNYHGSMLKKRLSEHVAIISKLIKCKNNRATMIFSPSMALCRESTSVVRISLIVSLNLESTSAYSTKSDLFITFVIYLIYATVARLFLANIFIFVLTFTRTYFHSHTNITHWCARISPLHIYHIHFANLLSEVLEEYLLFTNVTLYNCNNLKKCIKDSQGHSKR